MGTKNEPAPNDCYQKAWPDEPMFTLIARDPLMPRLIDLWVFMRQGGYIPEHYAPVIDLNAEDSKEMEAIRIALAARDWFGKNGDDTRFGGNLPPLIVKEVEPKVRVHTMEGKGAPGAPLGGPGRPGKYTV